MVKKDKTEKEPASSEPDPNLYYGNGEFTLPNGDSYAGDYCAHRYGLIWREGRGIYTTKDGQTYEGEWKDDKLVEEKEVVIKFPSGEEYHGPTLQDKYAGAGTYSMENKMDISCIFVDNKPKGNVMLIDINGRIWEGQAGENNVLLLPENQFYFSISDDTGVGKLKSKYQSKEELKSIDGNVNVSEEKMLSYRELEKNIFAKSTKTLNDIDFTESKWCQRYLRYKTMKNKISEKFKDEDVSPESLTDEEKRWQRKYQKHKLEQREKKKQKKIEKAKDSLTDTHSLLDAFYSKEFKNSCPPIKIFHPSCNLVDDYLETVEKTEEREMETLAEVEKIETTELAAEKVIGPKTKKK